MSTDFPPARRQCRSCGADILWLPAVDRRPLETTPVEPAVTDIGYVVMRDVHGQHHWVPSAHLPEPPPLHVRVHSCAEWREEQTNEEIDALHISTGLLTP